MEATHEFALDPPSREDELHRIIRDRLHQFPYLAVAAGTGLGFVLAGGLSNHKTLRVLGALGGLALFSPIRSKLITAGMSLLQSGRS